MKNNNKKIIIFLSLGFFSLVAVLVLAIFFRLFSNQKTINIDKNKFPIIGIDVSKHNGEIDWRKIKDIKFAFIKSTEGVDYLDPKFNYNITNAKKSAIKVGAYHFFSFTKNGTEQADNYLSKVNIDLLDITPILDVEENLFDAYLSNKVVVLNNLSLFLEKIEKRTGEKALIYTNLSTYKKYIQANFSNNPIWICSIDDTLNTNKLNNIKFWQYSHCGKIEGVPENIDLNVFCGNEKQWLDYLKK